METALIIGLQTRAQNNQSPFCLARSCCKNRKLLGASVASRLNRDSNPEHHPYKLGAYLVLLWASWN